MKIPIAALCVLAMVLLQGHAEARTYTTNFSLTENPISEGGNWVNGKAVGLDWADVATVRGLAFGTETGRVNYDDSTAVLDGAWGANQTAQATVYSVNQNSSIFEEVELRLRTTITANQMTGYEIDFRCLNTLEGYVQIVRWNGPLGSWTLLDGRSGGVKNGDLVKATIVGNVITAYVNGTRVLQVTDVTYATGSPGIGFYLQGTTNNAVQRDYGFTSFSAADDGSSVLPPPANLRIVK